MTLRKLIRRGDAEQRQSTRATRTDSEQLLHLDKLNGGKGKGAVKERARLTQRIKQAKSANSNAQKKH